MRPTTAPRATFAAAQTIFGLVLFGGIVAALAWVVLSFGQTSEPEPQEPKGTEIPAPTFVASLPIDPTEPPPATAAASEREVAEAPPTVTPASLSQGAVTPPSETEAPEAAPTETGPTPTPRVVRAAQSVPTAAPTAAGGAGLAPEVVPTPGAIPTAPPQVAAALENPTFPTPVPAQIQPAATEPPSAEPDATSTPSPRRAAVETPPPAVEVASAADDPIEAIVRERVDTALAEAGIDSGDDPPPIVPVGGDGDDGGDDGDDRPRRVAPAIEPGGPGAEAAAAIREQVERDVASRIGGSSRPGGGSDRAKKANVRNDPPKTKGNDKKDDKDRKPGKGRDNRD